ncbi:MAG: spore protease YyaC [Clostridiales bacterium]|nr:spore protease YyaC [Clostridiales bacterium]
MENYSFNIYNNYCSNGICAALDTLNKNKVNPVFICIGSDLVLGDSLGPLVGTFLKDKNIPNYIYGTLKAPITAKEVNYAGELIENTHQNSICIAIDAAVGEAGDIGLIRVVDKGLKPGLGVNKNLNQIGDISIIAVVAEKSLRNESLLNLTRLNLVYKMAKEISNGIEKHLKNITTYNDQQNEKLYGA